MVAALGVILGPILWRGAGAVVFKGTVEYRKMQRDLFGRGDREQIEAELAAAAKARQPAYEILDRFRRGLDVEVQIKEARRLYREVKKQLAHRRDAGEITDEDAREIKHEAKALRDLLADAYETADANEAQQHLAALLARSDDPRLTGSLAGRFFDLAREYRRTVDRVDLSKRREYADDLVAIRDILRKLLGPRPGMSVADLAKEQYGATRWDRARIELDNLLWKETWVPGGEGGLLKKQRVRRRELFAGTEMAAFFPLVERNIEQMLRPRRTVYWQYVIDGSRSGYFFGGVGPEALGTLLVAVLAMAVAFPLGVTSAAYLVECAGDNALVRIIRTCINSLAGVPSIVFGLFGLAFIVLYLQPKLGLDSQKSIFAGGLTLAVLVLPVVIRASEEAIRAVPRSYREASLALGAGKLRTFLTVTFPAALPGILTGVILSMSRAAGETAPLLFTAAVTRGPIPGSLAEPSRMLTSGSYDIAVGDRLAPQVPHKQFGMVATLILLVLLLNVVAIAIRWRVSRKLQGR
jgi:phosphate transport system permease protein